MIRFRDPLADPEPLIERVYAYVAYRLGDGPEAEDVTSETFARALRYRHTYDRAKGEPIAWLLGIAQKCIAAARAPRLELLTDSSSEQSESFERQTLDRVMLAAAVARLDDRDRDLIALRYGADLTAAQIAARLALTTNAAEVALHRALARLRVQLDVPPTEQGTNEAVRVSGAPAISLRKPRSASTGEMG